jgi:glycerophosphoryl diester phosphodiesterase
VSNPIARWRRPDRPLVIAHRGASARATENTAEAVELAAELGADAVEIDVQLARCGKLVVFHDDSLERLTGVRAAVSERSLDQLRRLPLIGGGRIAGLDEILEAAGDLLIDLEVKSARPTRSGPLSRAVASAVARHRRRGDILISSFDPAVLVRLRRWLPGVPTAYLFHMRQSLPLRAGWPAAWLGCDAVHPEHTLVTAARMKRWRSRGLVVNPWTVDRPERIRALAALGVDGFCTNDPEVALAALTDVGAGTSPGR